MCRPALPLARADAPRTNPQASIAAGANGVRETTQARDASVVHRLSCTAMDEGGRKFALEFVGDGRRVSFPRREAADDGHEHPLSHDVAGTPT